MYLRVECVSQTLHLTRGVVCHTLSPFVGHEEYFWSSLTRLTLLMETERTQRVRRRSKNTEFAWKKKKKKEKVHLRLGRDFSSHQRGEAVNLSITLMDQLISPRSSEGAALSVSMQISSGGRCRAS